MTMLTPLTSTYSEGFPKIVVSLNVLFNSVTKMYAVFCYK